MKENKSGLLNEAMGQVGDKYADSAKTAESAAKIKKNGRTAKIVALICAAALLLAAIPAGVFMAIRNINDVPETPEADPIVFNGGAYSTGAADLPDALRRVSVTAEGTASKIMPVSGSFLITTAEKTDVKTLTDYISITPRVDTSVEQLSDTQFRVSPASGALASGTVYRVTVGDPLNPAISYAFQTETRLIVKSMLPADLALNVPVDTGIEITFSDSVKGADFSEYVKVSPEVKGSFLLYPDGRTLAFVPAKKLAYDTVYTVEVKDGITGISGKTLAEGSTASFRTMSESYAATQDGNDGYFFSLYVDAYSDHIYSPGAEAVINYSVSKYSQFVTDFTSVSVSGTLYKFASAETAAKEIAEHEKKLGSAELSDAPYDLSGLTKIGSCKADDDGRTIDFGNKLEKGVYLAEITAKTKYRLLTSLSSTRYVIIQISDLRPYTVSTDGKLLLWLNSAQGSRVADAKIEATAFERTAGWDVDAASFKTLSAKSAADGTAILEIGNANGAVVRAEKDGDGIVVCANLLAEESENYYMSYVYTDRDMYFSTDKVNFFGFIINSYTGEVPEKLYLQTGYSVLKTPVEIGADGSFTGSFSFEQMSAGGLYLKLVDDDGMLYASKYIRITEEEKPQYTASLEFDKLFYRRGEKGKVTLTASFFDGTPVEGLEFTCSLTGHDQRSQNNTVTTDKNGQATFSFKTGQIKAYSTDPATVSVYAELINFETQRLFISAQATYFHSEYVLSTVWEKTSRRITLNSRDYSKLLTSADLQWQNLRENSVGKPAEGSVSYSLHKVVYTKTLKHRYDTYSKRTVDYWEWNRNDSVQKSGNFSFTNGVIDLPLYKAEGFEGGYYYDISFYDDSSSNSYRMSISANENGDADWMNNSEPRTAVRLDREVYGLGDKVSAQLTCGDTPLDALFVLCSNGLEKVSVGKEFTADFSAAMVPGAFVYAVNYDAQTDKFVCESAYVPYDYSDYAALDVTIETDKTQYRPGDTAAVKIHSAKGAGGKVLISIVDEACFALCELEIDASEFYFSNAQISQALSGNLFGLYPSAYYYEPYYYGGSYSRTASGKQVILNSRFSGTAQVSGGSRKSLNYSAFDVAESAVNYEDAAPGAANDSSDKTHVRRDFADNPAFSVVALDKNGDGTLVLTVPDNITSWRITACAASGLGTGAENVKLGTAVSDVICTQPFFINISACKTYLAGDTVSVAARSYGPAADGKVGYSAAIYAQDGTLIEKTSASADSKERAWLKFGSLDAGCYYIVTAGKCGDGEDAVRTDVQIIESAVAADVRRFVSADEIAKIKAKYYPVTLTFTNPTSAGRLYDAVTSKLSCGDGSGRADMLVAKYVAILASEALYGTESGEDLEALKSTICRCYNASARQVSLLSYSEGDAALTAQVLAVAPEVFSQSVREAMLNSLYADVSSKEQRSPEELAQKLASLAALGEPVLDRLYAVADYANSWSDEAKLSLALAFACCGDYSAANDIYLAIREKLGEENAEYQTLGFKAKNVDERVRLTTFALLVASRTAREDAEMLARWLVENNSRSESPALGLASYLKYFLPTETVPERSFSFTVGDFSESVTLKSGRCYVLTLTKSELESFKLNSFDEGIKIRAAYRGSLEDALGEGSVSQRISISKRFEKYGNGMYKVSITVSGKSTRVNEYFDLNDTIPSGARFVRLETDGYTYNKGSIRTWASLWNRSGQDVTGCVSVCNYEYGNSHKWREASCPEYSFSVTVSYVIRGAVEGRFTAEPAFIRLPENGSFAVSERFLVDIYEHSAWKFAEAKEK